MNTISIRTHTVNYDYRYDKHVVCKFCMHNKSYDIHLKHKQFSTFLFSIWYDGIEREIPNLTLLSEEELFQISTLWEHQCDIGLVRTAQRYLLLNLWCITEIMGVAELPY